MVIGGAAPGLAGLLFVAVSIRIEVIAKSQELRNRAAQTLAMFVTVLFVAILLAIPNQSRRVLGLELVALAILIGESMLIRTGAPARVLIHVTPPRTRSPR